VPPRRFLPDRAQMPIAKGGPRIPPVPPRRFLPDQAQMLAAQGGPRIASRFATVSTRVVPGASSAAPRFGARAIGAARPDQPVRVTIVLRRPSGSGSRFAARDAAAALPQKRTYLSREQLAEQDGATESDTQALAIFAEANGLRIVRIDAARRSVVLAGSVSQLNAAFGVQLTQYRLQGQVFRGLSADSVVRVPPALANSVVGVFGLENFPVARPHIRLRSAAAAGVSYRPQQVARLYNFPPRGAVGETIGIIELDGGYRPADLQRYFSQHGLRVPHITDVSVNGGANHPTGDPGGPDGEVCLDIEVAAAVAPGADIVVYFTPNTDRGFVDAVTAAIHDNVNKPTVISISWGNAESLWSAQARRALNQAFQDAATIGITITAASGDDGSRDNVNDGRAHVDFPASSPWVLGCGGTTLSGSGLHVSRETAWHDSGGGVSSSFKEPSWQRRANVPKGRPAPARGGRGVPDVSGNANPATGYDVIIDGQASVVGGTSAVAPLWAGLIACMNSALGKPVGLLNPLLYGLAGPALWDITSGNNGAYRAGPGWDPVTGLGSPNGKRLLAALTGRRIS
jgi:kumamolisin